MMNSNDRQFSHTVYPVPRSKSYWVGKTVLERAGWNVGMYLRLRVHDYLVQSALEKLVICTEKGACDAMLVLGDPGAGKTAMVDYLIRVTEGMYPSSDSGEITIRSVLALPVPDPATPSQLCIDILRALGDPRPERRKRSELCAFAKKMLRSCEVRIVLVDNFQDVPERRAKRGIELLSSKYRELMDASAALWFFTGTQRALQVRDADDQLIKRIPFFRHLPYLDLDTKRGRSDFKSMLITLDEWLPMTEPSFLTKKECAGPLWFATDGILDRIIRLVDRAWRVALAAGREILVRADLHKAFERLFGNHIENPFDGTFRRRRLNREGEPYHKLHNRKGLSEELRA
jgi:hypothetical protein